MDLKRWVTLVICAMVALGQPGCWDLEEINNLALVLALGLDAGEGEEMEVSFQLSIPRNLAGGGGPPGGGAGQGGSASPAQQTLLISMGAPNVSRALERLGLVLSRRPTLVQNEVLVVGEELARRGLARHLGGLQRLPEFRGNVPLLVTKGRAASLLQIRPQLEPRPSKYLEDLLRQGHHAGLSPLVRMSDFLSTMEVSAVHAVTPLVDKAGESQARIVGAAAFHGGSLVGELDVEETRWWLMLAGQWRQGTLTVDDPRDPKYPLTLMLSAAHPRVRVRRREGEPVRIEVSIFLRAEVQEAEAPRQDPLGPGDLEALARGVEEMLNRRMAALVRRTQQELAADIFGFGRRVRMTFTVRPAWEAFDWDLEYPRAEIVVRNRIAMKWVGLTYGPPVPD